MPQLFCTFTVFTIDGGHTYKIICEANDKQECPASQYVKIEVLTGINPDWIPFIVGGLNTAVQVQTSSLENLKGSFDWIKLALDGQPFASRIAYRENERNADEKPYDIREIISWLALFNIDLYPRDGSRFPMQAYTSKDVILQEYVSNQDSYKKLLPILVDILCLHDNVHTITRDRYNKSGGRTGLLAFVRERKRGEFDLHFINEKTKYILYDGALFPMLGAFRWMVEDANGRKSFKWRGKGYESVLELLHKVAGQLMASTKNVSCEMGRNPNAIGKSKSHWENLYRTVAMAQLSF